MSLIALTCVWCGSKFTRREVLWLRNGPLAFCDRACFGLYRRKGKTLSTIRAEKAAYDRVYRVKNLKRIKLRKAEYFQRTYDPAVARIERHKNMARHVEYCRHPNYRKYKRRYDGNYRARKLFGDFAESAKLLKRLDAEIGKRMSDYEIRLQQGTINKKQQRRRQLL